MRPNLSLQAVTQLKFLRCMLEEGRGLFGTSGLLRD